MLVRLILDGYGPEINAPVRPCRRVSRFQQWGGNVKDNKTSCPHKLSAWTVSRGCPHRISVLAARRTWALEYFITWVSAVGNCLTFRSEAGTCGSLQANGGSHWSKAIFRAFTSSISPGTLQGMKRGFVSIASFTSLEYHKFIFSTWLAHGSWVF